MFDENRVSIEDVMLEHLELRQNIGPSAPFAPAVKLTTILQDTDSAMGYGTVTLRDGDKASLFILIHLSYLDRISWYHWITDVRI